MNLLKQLRPFFISILLTSCNAETGAEEVQIEVGYDGGPVNLLDCPSSDFKEIFKELDRLLPNMYPNCEEYSVAYKALTEDEKDLMVKCMNETIARRMHDKADLDSSYFGDFVFTDLQFCGSSLEYSEHDSCSFYAGAIYHSSDLKIQFIRLFQTGRAEFMDVYLDLSGPEPEVFAFG